MNDELVNKIEQLLNQFATEELGNRLSQFALIALKEMILNELRNKPNKSEVINDVKK